MAKIDAVDIPKLLFAEGAAPGTPASGKVHLYAKADGLLYSKDDAGVETAVSGNTPAFVGCMAVRTTDQTGVVTATDTNVLFNGTDEIDTHAYHDPAGANPERITIPSGKDGKYLFTAYIIFDVNATGLRAVKFAKNGATISGQVAPAPAGGADYAQLSAQLGPIAAVAGDYFTVQVRQNSGANRTLSGTIATLRFGATFLGT